MSSENKAIVRRFLEEVLNERNLMALEQYVSADAADHLNGSMAWYLVLSAFPDFRLTIEHMIADGENVTVLASFSGTHRSSLMGIAPTGKGVTSRVAFNFRVAEQKIVESWMEFEPWGLMQQVGVSPLAKVPHPSFTADQGLPVQ